MSDDLWWQHAEDLWAQPPAHEAARIDIEKARDSKVADAPAKEDDGES